MRARPLHWLLATLGAAGLACALGGAPPTDAFPAATIAPETPLPGAATPTQIGQAATGAAPEPTPAAVATGPFEYEFELGPGEFLLPDPRVGLAELASYQAALTVSFDGTHGGQPLQWSETYTVLTTRAPADRQLTLTRTGGEGTPQFVAEVEGVGYERRGDGDCTATVLAEGPSQLDRLEPAGLLSPVLGAEAAGSDSLNGLAADHYTFDERALGQVGLTTSAGELWVASDGGYLVRYTLTSQGGEEYFGAGRAGTLTVAYDLTGVNATAPTPLPADCPPGFITAPLLAEAANVVRQPGLLTFDSAAGLAEAAAFYEAELPAAGWTATTPTVILAETTALLDFAQGEAQLSVVIATTPTGTSVRLILVRAAPR